jgi:hypothetical protein
MLKLITLIALAASVLAGTPAQAEGGWKRMLFWLDEPQEQAQPYFFDTPRDDEEEGVILVPVSRSQASIYGDDLDYYEPRLVPSHKVVPAPKLKKAVAAAKSDKKLVLATSRQELSAPKITASGFTCDKGVAVVTGYGFSGVASKSCAGKIFTYRATRASKAFEVSVSALNGEITEVRKVQ